MDSALTEAWLALAGTVAGGSGLKFIEYILGRSKYRDTLAGTIRGELRADLSAAKAENAHLHERIEDLEDEVDEWRDKYYQLVADNAKRGLL